MLGRGSFLLAVVATTLLASESFACNRVQAVVVQQQVAVQAVPSYGCATCAAPVQSFAVVPQMAYVQPSVAVVPQVSYQSFAVHSYAQPVAFANIGYGGGFGAQARFGGRFGGRGGFGGRSSGAFGLGSNGVGGLITDLLPAGGAAAGAALTGGTPLGAAAGALGGGILSNILRGGN